MGNSARSRPLTLLRGILSRTTAFRITTPHGSVWSLGPSVHRGPNCGVPAATNRVAEQQSALHSFVWPGRGHQSPQSRRYRSLRTPLFASTARRRPALRGLRRRSGSWLVLRFYTLRDPAFLDTLAEPDHEMFSTDGLAKFRFILTGCFDKPLSEDCSVGLRELAGLIGHAGPATLFEHCVHTL
jgi:hypothetical protein